MGELSTAGFVDTAGVDPGIVAIGLASNLAHASNFVESLLFLSLFQVLHVLKGDFLVSPGVCQNAIAKTRGVMGELEGAILASDEPHCDGPNGLRRRARTSKNEKAEAERCRVSEVRERGQIGEMTM